MGGQTEEGRQMVPDANAEGVLDYPAFCFFPALLCFVDRLESVMEYLK